MVTRAFCRWRKSPRPPPGDATQFKGKRRCPAPIAYPEGPVSEHSRPVRRRPACGLPETCTEFTRTNRFLDNGFIVKLVSAGWLITGIVLGAPPAAAQLKLVAVDVRVPVPPTAFLADAKTQLVYELRITNLDRNQMTLSAIDVYAD